MEEAEFSGSFLFSGWRVCLWRGWGMGGWQPHRPTAEHRRYEESTVSPKALDRDRTPEAAETSSPAPKRPPLGAIPRGQKK